MPTTVALNLTGEPYPLSTDLWRVFLQPGKPEGPLQAPIDAALQLNWRELDRLPKLKEIHYTGRDAGVVAYTVSRQELTRLAWHEHGQATIDLRDTTLQHIAVDAGDTNLALQLPTSGTTETLTIHVGESVSGVRVKAPEQGRGIRLTLWYHDRAGAPPVVPGLERIVSLDVYHAGQVNLASLSGYRELQRLDLRGPGASVPDIAALAQWQELRSFRLLECYDFDAESLPSPADMPRLEELVFDGLRADAAALIAKQWKGFTGLKIRGKRSPAWIRDNLGNPFFTWGGEHGPAAGSLACRIYKTASTALDKLGEDANPNDVRAILEKFVASFNRFEAKHDIDTLMREQIAGAYDELARRKVRLVDEEETQQWFETLRDF